MDDPNFELVMEYSDSISRAVYREEAKTIEGLRSAIVEVSSKEQPYDIFICYKETDENGERTIDSVIAQNVYAEGKGPRGFRMAGRIVEARSAEQSVNHLLTGKSLYHSRMDDLGVVRSIRLINTLY